jgi:hypothetical protein
LLYMCPSANGQVFAVKEQYRWVDGQRERVKDGYIVKFRKDRSPTQAQYDQAMRSFSYRGTGTRQDMVTKLDPIWDEGRLSFFDTEWVPEHQRAEVEKVMAEHPDSGRDWVLVEEEKADPPWPSYDELQTTDTRDIQWVVDQITARVVDNGYDPIIVHNYERIAHGRSEVLDALLKLANPKDEVVEVAA